LELICATFNLLHFVRGRAALWAGAILGDALFSTIILAYDFFSEMPTGDDGPREARIFPGLTSRF
jgi:hypothetical protein